MNRIGDESNYVGNVYEFNSLIRNGCGRVLGVKIRSKLSKKMGLKIYRL
jgi:hypothetical protein